MNLNDLINIPIVSSRGFIPEKTIHIHIDTDWDLIDDISKIRVKNNENWMKILKLAFQYAPNEAKKIMQNITECDIEINKLSKQLGESK
jgi:hypothetical protein